MNITKIGIISGSFSEVENLVDLICLVWESFINRKFKDEARKITVMYPDQFIDAAVAAYSRRASVFNTSLQSRQRVKKLFSEINPDYATDMIQKHIPDKPGCHSLVIVYGVETSSAMACLLQEGFTMYAYDMPKPKRVSIAMLKHPTLDEEDMGSFVSDMLAVGNEAVEQLKVDKSHESLASYIISNTF
jgi:hypothetical protein